MTVARASTDAPVALVAGATRGIGRETALAFARANWRVVVVGRSTDEAPNPVMKGTLEEVEADLRAFGTEVLGVAANLASPDGVAKVREQTETRFGGCDALVINFAYSTDYGAPIDTPFAKWNTSLKVNVLGPVLLLQAFLPAMLDRGRGSVLTISTGAAAHYVEGQLPYSVTKAALEQTTFGFAEAYGDRGVAFNVVRADGVPTETFLQVGRAIGVVRPGMRYSTPEEVGKALVWVASQPPSFTGRTLTFPDLQALGALPEPTFTIEGNA